MSLCRSVLRTGQWVSATEPVRAASAERPPTPGAQPPPCLYLLPLPTCLSWSVGSEKLLRILPAPGSGGCLPALPIKLPREREAFCLRLSSPCLGGAQGKNEKAVGGGLWQEGVRLWVQRLWLKSPFCPLLQVWLCVAVWKTVWQLFHTLIEFPLSRNPTPS